MSRNNIIQNRDIIELTTNTELLFIALESHSQCIQGFAFKRLADIYNEKPEDPRLYKYIAELTTIESGNQNSPSDVAFVNAVLDIFLSFLLASSHDLRHRSSIAIQNERIMSNLCYLVQFSDFEHNALLLLKVLSYCPQIRSVNLSQIFNKETTNIGIRRICYNILSNLIIHGYKIRMSDYLKLTRHSNLFYEFPVITKAISDFENNGLEAFIECRKNKELVVFDTKFWTRNIDRIHFNIIQVLSLISTYIDSNHIEDVAIALDDILSILRICPSLCSYFHHLSDELTILCGSSDSLISYSAVTIMSICVLHDYSGEIQTK